MIRLLEALEDHDDVQNVHANFDIDEKLPEEVAGCSYRSQDISCRPPDGSVFATSTLSTSQWKTLCKTRK
jgi:hypothetical protein